MSCRPGGAEPVARSALEVVERAGAVVVIVVVVIAVAVVVRVRSSIAIKRVVALLQIEGQLRSSRTYWLNQPDCPFDV